MARPVTLTPAALLEVLTATPVGPSVLAKQLNVSRATVHRKLEQLLEEGLVVRAGEGPQAAYRLPSPHEELARSRQQGTEGRVRFLMCAGAARAVQTSLEVFSRIGIGQLEQIAEQARFGEIKRVDDVAVSFEKVDELSESLKFHLLGFERGASFGIYSPKVHPNVLRTWAVQRALRHRLAWDQKPQGSFGVWHDEPLDADSIPGLFVHSDEPDAQGKPGRYILEMPNDCVAPLREALRFALRLTTGEVRAVVELARDQLLRYSSGDPVPAASLEKGDILAAALEEELTGVSSGSLDVALTPTQGWVLQAVKALERFEVTKAEVVVGSADQGEVRVEPVTDSPWAVNVDELPAGMLLNYHQGRYRVIAPAKDDGHLIIVAVSHSLKTVLQMAKNVAEGRSAREYSM